VKGKGTQCDRCDNSIILVSQWKKYGLNLALEAGLAYIFIIMSGENFLESGNIFSEIPVIDITIIEKAGS
jgi:hypothetical protein